MSGLLCVQSHFGPPNLLFKEAASRQDVILINQTDLDTDLVAGATGLITTMHLDQIGLMDFREALKTMLDRGGRWFFNGHIMRPFLPELGLYQPTKRKSVEALSLTPLLPHSVFIGVDRAALAKRKGVAGFYGRGCNPMPAGATAITGLGPDLSPIDWEWQRPLGGTIFSHSGNDLVSTPEEEVVSVRLARNVIDWAVGRSDDVL